MATNIEMPQMGFDMQEGTVVKWRKAEGDEITRGEVIAEIETDKAVVEMEAYASGILKKLVVEEGQTVPVGTLIAIITAPDEDLPSLEDMNIGTLDPRTITGSDIQSADTGVSQNEPGTTDAKISRQPSAEPRSSPIARRLAKELGIDLSNISGTGPGGRITEADINAHSEASSTPATPVASDGIQRSPLSKMRQAIANSTIRSMRDAPHFYVTMEIDMGKSIDMRRDMNNGLPKGVRISVNDLIIKACALAIVKFPNFNASYQDNQLLKNPNINIGLAIALEQGLIIASIPRCESKSLVDITQASKDLIERAHDGTLKAEEYTGSTFTISNLGMYDVDSFSAIIYPPNAAVVAIGAVKDRPVVREKEIVVARMMKATISVDHRVVDGAEAAQFLREVKKLLQNPDSLVV